MSPNEAAPAPELIQAPAIEPTPPTPVAPKRKRILEGEEGFQRKSPRVVVPVYVTNLWEAESLVITKTAARQFNGIDYVSFPSPIHIDLGPCVCKTSTNKFDKMLVACPNKALIEAVENIVERSASEQTGPEYTYMSLQQPEADVYRFKWTPRGNKASMFIRSDAAQKLPLADDAGPLVLEISGFYFNKSTKTSGATARVVSFKKE